MIWAGYGIDFNLASLLPQAQPITQNTSTGARIIAATALPSVQTVLAAGQALQPANPFVAGQRRAPASSTTGYRVIAATTLPSTSSLIQAAQAIRNASAGGVSADTAAILASLYGKSGAASGSAAAAAATPGDAAAQCASAGGRWDVDGCLLATGEKLGVGADGQPYCMNAVGACASAGAAAGGGSKTVMLLGAAALAALFLLK